MSSPRTCRLPWQTGQGPQRATEHSRGMVSVFVISFIHPLSQQLGSGQAGQCRGHRRVRLRPVTQPQRPPPLAP